MARKFLRLGPVVLLIVGISIYVSDHFNIKGHVLAPFGIGALDFRNVTKNAKKLVDVKA